MQHCPVLVLHPSALGVLPGEDLAVRRGRCYHLARNVFQLEIKVGSHAGILRLSRGPHTFRWHHLRRRAGRGSCVKPVPNSPNGGEVVETTIRKRIVPAENEPAGRR